MSLLTSAAFLLAVVRCQCTNHSGDSCDASDAVSTLALHRDSTSFPSNPTLPCWPQWPSKARRRFRHLRSKFTAFLQDCDRGHPERAQDQSPRWQRVLQEDAVMEESTGPHTCFQRRVPDPIPDVPGENLGGPGTASLPELRLRGRAGGVRTSRSRRCLRPRSKQWL